LRRRTARRCGTSRLEKENDQKDDQDQQENATTDIHLQPPWSQVIRVDTRFAEEINPIHVRVHKVLKTEPIGSALRAGTESPSPNDGRKHERPVSRVGEGATDRRATPTPPAA
jgi:hypothetical protein